MTTPKTFARRLRKLADYLETEVAVAVKEKRVKWDMNQWATKAPKPELACGTAACAAGYGTNVFPRALGLKPLWGDLKYRGDELEVFSRASGAGGLLACEEFFGTDVPFDPYSYRAQNPGIRVVVARLRAEADKVERA